MNNRMMLASLSLSAAALVGIAVHEGYRDTAYIPVPGDGLAIGVFTVFSGDQPRRRRA